MRQRTELIVAAIIVSLVANLHPLLIWQSLWNCPPGSVLIAPRETLWSIFGLVMSLVVDIPLGRSLMSVGNVKSGWACVVFSMTPFLVNITVVVWTCWVRQLSFES